VAVQLAASQEGLSSMSERQLYIFVRNTKTGCSFQGTDNVRPLSYLYLLNVLYEPKVAKHNHTK
jgi:hypothetical protein